MLEGFPSYENDNKKDKKMTQKKKQTPFEVMILAIDAQAKAIEKICEIIDAHNAVIKLQEQRIANLEEILGE